MENLKVEVDDRLAVVTIDRPEVRNALSRQVLAELRDVLVELRDADDVGPVAFTGTGGQVIEQLAQAVLYTTTDKAEGASAFLEKRPPSFNGV